MAASREMINMPVEIKRGPKELIQEVRAAFDSGLFIATLTLLVTIPDVCESLISDNYRTNSRMYKDWVGRYLNLEFRNEHENGVEWQLGEIQECVLSPDDLYQLRCSVLHNGSGAIDSTGGACPYDNIAVFANAKSSGLVIGFGRVSLESSNNVEKQMSNTKATISLDAYISETEKGVARFLVDFPAAKREQTKGTFSYRGLYKISQINSWY